MFINSIETVNHPILGNFALDFTKDGKPSETVIIAGENGSGKSTLLEVIYEFGSLRSGSDEKNEKRIFKITLTKEEVKIFVEGGFPHSEIENNEIYFNFDYSVANTRDYLKLKYKYYDQTNGKYIPYEMNGSIFRRGNLKSIFRAIFSDVGINFSGSKITNITSKALDSSLTDPIRSPRNIADEISQLLVDIRQQDAEDILVEIEQSGKYHTESISPRMRRFIKAFDYMFETKRFKEIRTSGSAKEIIFEENGRESNIYQLSSGEKQIVFRGSFLLENKNSLKGNIVLIDEPEISMHPKWQLKILDFYKSLFTNEQGQQTSQIIIVTHSPFIIQNGSRFNDKVITLSKNGSNIVVDDPPKYFGFTMEDFVKDSFDVDLITHADKIVLFSEGKNFNYINKALELLKISLPIEVKDTKDINSDQLYSMYINFKKSNLFKGKIIFLWDCDANTYFSKCEQTEDLTPMILSKNLNNTKIPGGIENMFDDQYLPSNLSEEFYITKVKGSDGGTTSTLDKKKFEEYILQHGTIDSFNNFASIFEEIGKLIK